jgi:hypothetical protein
MATYIWVRNGEDDPEVWIFHVQTDDLPTMLKSRCYRRTYPTLLKSKWVEVAGNSSDLSLRPCENMAAAKEKGKVHMIEEV